MKSLLFVFSFIILSSATRVRLRGIGSSPHQGRVEVYHNGSWGTVCDRDWTDNEASVICRMLNFSKGGKAYGQARFGEGSGPILLKNVKCVSEYISDIPDCYHRGWGNHNYCNHRNDAGVACTLSECESGTFGTNCLQRCHCKIPGCHNMTGVCNNAGCQDGWEGSSCDKGGTRVRLIGSGSSPYQGRVEVYHNGEWGTICDDGWTNVEASVICRMLDFSEGGQAYGKAHFGEGSGPILLDNVRCSPGYISDISDCYHRGWGNHNCNHRKDAGVACRLSATRVRLRGIGSSPHQGRVEVYHNGSWGTICDDSWTDEDASVICRMLNMSNGGKAYGQARFGRGSGPILLDQVNCVSGYIEDISDCNHAGWGKENCGHQEDAGVVCRVSGYTRVRLRGNGSSSHQGRVEIYHNSEWGTICDDFWTDEDASVICRMLDLSKRGKAYGKARFGEGSGPILLDDVRCLSGHIGDLSDCRHRLWGKHNCDHSEDAGVVCTVFECESGLFGTYCLRRCHCKVPGCHHVTGVCNNAGCQDGWEGSSCDKECERGAFGPDCLQTCHCKVPGCHHVTGVCHNAGCQDGWEGSSCDKECKNGAFGPDCLQTCNCKIPGCHHVTGVCNNAGCQDGWEGSSCDKECERGAFGPDCLQTCHCKVPGCHHMTGVCNNAGCQDGWDGVSCDKVVTAVNMVYIIGIALGILLVASVATNIALFATRKRKDENNLNGNASYQDALPNRRDAAVTSDRVYEDLEFEVMPSQNADYECLDTTATTSV
ncbi:deleted in malignant brain tumors 1 protein-like isoform X2 [Mizuhopecten yessoensis]|uniref:deleted in malignant brain tumors 1 protein-like isoform X2 n=1 Tax=Mizuhopecten yessoensis TaxID=6573 RepID=UPI000B45BC5F|nr:deleted in malignant brain tumors 1 protein-like isoform X2 [Mizuhopecten yessoensis]